MPIACTKRCLLDVLLSDSRLVIARSQIYFQKVLGALKLVEKLVDPQKRILVFHHWLAQLLVVTSSLIHLSSSLIVLVHPMGTYSV